VSLSPGMGRGVGSGEGAFWELFFFHRDFFLSQSCGYHRGVAVRDLPHLQKTAKTYSNTVTIHSKMQVGLLPPSISAAKAPSISPTSRFSTAFFMKNHASVTTPPELAGSWSL
jgi:hypothetical protein